MNDTEQELIEQLKADLVHPDQLYQKEYIQNEGVTSDTKRPIQEILASYLVSHIGDMKQTDTNWGLFHTSVQPVSGAVSRTLSAIGEQKEFFHGIFLGGRVQLTDGMTQEVGRFDFMTLGLSGNMISLFQMMPSPVTESPLTRILRLWSWKESVSKHALQKALDMEKKFRLQAVALVTGASNERYGHREETPIVLKQLAALLGVSTLYLFHGIYAEPVSLGLPASGQMSRAELLQQLERDQDHPELWYQKDYVNRFGRTSDTQEPYCQVLSEWMLQHRDRWMGVPHGLYRLMEGNMLGYGTKNPWLQQIRKQKVLPPFGRVLSSDMTFLGSRGQSLGRPAMLVYDGEEGERKYSILRMVERADSTDTLLRAVLRSFTHLVMTDREKLMKDLKLPEETNWEARILVDAGSPQADHFQRDLVYVNDLMKAMGVGIIFLKDGYEAMY